MPGSEVRKKKKKTLRIVRTVPHSWSRKFQYLKLFSFFAIHTFWILKPRNVSWENRVLFMACMSYCQHLDTFLFRLSHLCAQWTFTWLHLYKGKKGQVGRTLPPSNMEVVPSPGASLLSQQLGKWAPQFSIVASLKKKINCMVEWPLYCQIVVVFFLKYNWFTMFCSFLLYTKCFSYTYIYIYIHSFLYSYGGFHIWCYGLS